MFYICNHLLNYSTDVFWDHIVFSGNSKLVCLCMLNKSVLLLYWNSIKLKKNLSVIRDSKKEIRLNCRSCHEFTSTMLQPQWIMSLIVIFKQQPVLHSLAGHWPTYWTFLVFIHVHNESLFNSFWKTPYFLRHWTEKMILIYMATFAIVTWSLISEISLKKYGRANQYQRFMELRKNAIN